MTFEELKDIIVDTLGCDEDAVTPDADFIKDLEADSLSILELNMALEDATGIKISDEELVNLHTANDILKYVEEHQ